MDRLIDDLSARLERTAIPGYAVWNQPFIEFAELRNMLDTARAIAAAAREREGSVGGHVRLDGASISAFSQPYSTVVRKTGAGAWQVRRVARPRTPLMRLIAYKLKENWRKAQIKALRMMPAKALDKQLEKRYRAIMGASGAAPEIAPGGVDGAIGEATKA